MAYKVLDDRDIKKWNLEYEEMSDKLAALPQNADPTERAKLTADMQALGNQVKAHLDEVGPKMRTYLNQHFAKVDNWVRLSELAITNARKAAATYKKDTSTGVPPQLHQAAADMTLWSKAIADDADEFGDAWFGYRGEMANKIPAQYQASFKALRAKVIEDRKSDTIKQTKIKGYIAEAEGLVKLTAKTTMKAGIKAGSGVQRPIADAQHDARELATQMAAELNELRNPHGFATTPHTISTTMESVRENSKDKAYTKTTGNMALLSGRKKIFENGIQLMRTKAASMEKILATKTRALRSNELSDATVKAEIKKAQQSLKDAKADLKASEVDAKKGMDASVVIEKRWAVEAKKK